VIQHPPNSVFQNMNTMTFAFEVPLLSSETTATSVLSGELGPKKIQVNAISGSATPDLHLYPVFALPSRFPQRKVTPIITGQARTPILP
jgi:hypothetical protein